MTHMDIAIGNTFITTSGFIILLLTIDRSSSFHHHYQSIRAFQTEVREDFTITETALTRAAFSCAY